MLNLLPPLRRSQRFNSLFEMLDRNRLSELAKLAQSFNSLFEMQGPGRRPPAWQRNRGAGFNSLFEMLPRRRRYVDNGDVSGFNSLFEMRRGAPRRRSL